MVAPIAGFGSVVRRSVYVRSAAAARAAAILLLVADPPLDRYSRAWTPRTSSTASPSAIEALDADAGNHLSPGALARFLQEIAAASADRLGFGYEALRARNHAWVLHGLRIQIFQRPGYHQTGPRRHLAPRTDPPARLPRVPGHGRRRPARRRRLERLGGHGHHHPPPHPSRPLPRPSLAPATGPWTATRSSRRPSPTPDAELKVRVRWSDLDLNGHLNNTRFLDLALETFEDAWLLAHEPVEVEMSFLAEGRRGDVLVSRRQPEGEGSFLHSLVREADGKELFRARTVWARSCACRHFVHAFRPKSRIKWRCAGATALRTALAASHRTSVSLPIRSSPAAFTS